MKIIVGVTGASGSIYGARFLEVLHEAYPEVESHLVVSRAGRRVLLHETDYDVRDLARWAGAVHSETDIGAEPASGSAGFDAMVIVPCSVKTLGLIASGTGDTLVGRAADVILKEGRRLVLVVREMPLSAIHLENMLKLSRLGVMILPASPGFYFYPKTMADLVDNVVHSCQVLLRRFQLQLGGATPALVFSHAGSLLKQLATFGGSSAKNLTNLPLLNHGVRLYANTRIH